MGSKVYDFLRDAGVFFYATVDGNSARVRPFGLCVEYEGKLYFGMGKHKQSYRQTVENPNVEISACNKDRQWIRIRGRAVFDERKEVLDYVLEQRPNLKQIYNEETGNVLALFYLEDATAEIADSRGYFESIRL